ncbi:endoglucanase 10 [Camponotus floridanus]|uniref:endoglucanase 10 n=1 Tax=Camponotus floridanus TaxID=104421 RepID=UPI000DC6CC78|nr:endoglucanase 10 [Camponotus floridanus]XP_025264354.1 endoglucanase 10 [Camponotus floridanus]
MKFSLFVYVTILLALLITLTYRINAYDIHEDIEDVSFDIEEVSFDGDKKDYYKVLKLSMLFYEAQRSGELRNNRIPWRDDSALQDAGWEDEDLTGGYYDGHNYVKFGFTMAFTTTVLAWGAISWPEAFNIANQLDEIRTTIKWATDYFIKCHVKENELYGQVGEFYLTETFWGRPEELPYDMYRPAYKINPEHPGSDVAGETAAALAVSSIVFKKVDPEYSAKCLKHAREIYTLANLYRDFYHKGIPNVQKYYNNTDYGDELAWAAIWLHKADSHFNYLNDAENHYQDFHLEKRPNEFSYNNKIAGVQMLLAQLTGKLEYKIAVSDFCNFSVHHQTRTPKGLLYIDKLGTLSHAANVAFICLVAADNEIGLSHQYYKFAKEQIDYILGLKAGRSYVVGYGINSPQQPYHIASSCPHLPKWCGWKQYRKNESNPQILYGALVSGPNENDEFLDIRYEPDYTNVRIDYNAGFTCVLAKLLQLHSWRSCMSPFSYDRLFN